MSEHVFQFGWCVMKDTSRKTDGKKKCSSLLMHYFLKTNMKTIKILRYLGKIHKPSRLSCGCSGHLFADMLNIPHYAKFTSPLLSNNNVSNLSMNYATW